MTAAPEKNYRAGHHDAEAQAQDREALPLARSSEMQQEWRPTKIVPPTEKATALQIKRRPIAVESCVEKSERSRSQIIG